MGICHPLPAQTHYALDANSGCWGEVPADPALSPDPTWTGEGWVYLQNDEAHNQLIFRTDHEPGNFSLSIFEGKAAAALTLAGLIDLETIGQTPLPLGAWAHLAACYESGGLRLFLNGQEDAFAAGVGSPAQAPGPIFIGGGDPDEQLFGLADEIRLSDTVRYSENFDPFDVPLVDLRVGDQVVPGWALGTEPGDLTVAWDSTSLYDIIDGEAVVYLAHNFQYAVRQYYYGQIGGEDVRLTLWMTDQGTPEDAEALFHDTLMVPFSYVLIDSIGEEARLDTGLLFDYMLDFWRDKYYVSVTLSKEYGEEEALQVALNFGAQADTNILSRHHFSTDANTTALWHFDEGSGSIFADASGNGHQGTLHNPAWAATTSYQAVLYITSARLLEGNLQVAEIDEDDTARVIFSDPVAPITIHSGNINAILQLSGGHSWLSGAGLLGSATWSDTWDTLRISFSLQGGSPTVADGDTIFPNPEWLVSDQGLAAGGYRFIRFDEISGINQGITSTHPRCVKLFPPHPTPFNATTRIVFELPKPASVTLRVLDVSGREVAVLFKGHEGTGRHSFTWNAGNFASGIYLISMQAGSEHLVKKVVLLK